MTSSGIGSMFGSYTRVPLCSLVCHFTLAFFSNLMSKNVTLLLPTFLYITRAVVVEIIEPSGFNKEVKDVHVLTVLVWNIWACSGMELAVTNIRDSISARGHDVSDGY